MTASGYAGQGEVVMEQECPQECGIVVVPVLFVILFRGVHQHLFPTRPYLAEHSEQTTFGLSCLLISLDLG